MATCIVLFATLVSSVFSFSRKYLPERMRLRSVQFSVAVSDLESNWLRFFHGRCCTSDCDSSFGANWIGFWNVTFRDKPLSMYIYSSNKTVTEYLHNNTSSGSICVNDCMMQFTGAFRLLFATAYCFGIEPSSSVWSFESLENGEQFETNAMANSWRVRCYATLALVLIQWLLRLWSVDCGRCSWGIALRRRRKQRDRSLPRQVQLWHVHTQKIVSHPIVWQAGRNSRQVSTNLKSLSILVSPYSSNLWVFFAARVFAPHIWT